MAGSNKVIQLADAQRAAARSKSAGPSSEADELALVDQLRAGEPSAERALLEQYTAHVERILTRILGGTFELDDLTQEVFVRAFERLSELREPTALRHWLTAIAVFVAREAIRKKQRRRWLVFLPSEETPELEVPAASAEARSALRAFYEVLSGMDADARIALTLRFVEGMELAEIAEACQVSLATIKRRIKRAAVDFYTRGMARAELVDWFEEGTRWQ